MQPLKFFKIRINWRVRPIMAVNAMAGGLRVEHFFIRKLSNGFNEYYLQGEIDCRCSLVAVRVCTIYNHPKIDGNSASLFMDSLGSSPKTCFQFLNTSSFKPSPTFYTTCILCKLLVGCSCFSVSESRSFFILMCNDLTCNQLNIKLREA